MAIYRLFQKMAFGPEEISQLETAYEQALASLNVVDRSHPVAQLIAKRIVEVAQTGIRGADRISTIAINDFRPVSD